MAREAFPRFRLLEDADLVDILDNKNLENLSKVFLKNTMVEGGGKITGMRSRQGEYLVFDSYISTEAPDLFNKVLISMQAAVKRDISDAVHSQRTAMKFIEWIERCPSNQASLIADAIRFVR